MEKPYRIVASKWVKTQTLLSNKIMAKHIPITVKFSEDDLRKMISRFSRVVLKPEKGTGGNGVIFIMKEGQGYVLRHSVQTENYREIKSLISGVDCIRNRRPYIIQQRIDLLKVNGRPIDFRIRMEKPFGTWIITRSIGRVARKGLLVTNLCKGGDELTLEQGLMKALGKRSVQTEREKMIQLARMGTRMLEKRFPGVRRLGFDFGLDQKGHIWIFEVNTKPA